MSDITVAATITRDNLDPAQAALDLDDGTNFVLGRSVAPGGVSWEKVAVTSPFVHGRVIVNERMGASEGGLEVHCLGATYSAAHTNVSTLLTAFTSQSEYTLTLTVEGVTHQWTCERADYEVGWVTETIAAHRIPVRLSFYRHPIPVAGAF